MNIALTKHFDELIARLVSRGRNENSGEVVRAGLRALEAKERSLAMLSFPPGSLKHLYGKPENQTELRATRASTLKV